MAPSTRRPTRELEELQRAQEDAWTNCEQRLPRRVSPSNAHCALMRGMADALEQFVALDLPFHQTERIGAKLTGSQGDCVAPNSR